MPPVLFAPVAGRKAGRGSEGHAERRVVVVARCVCDFVYRFGRDGKPPLGLVESKTFDFGVNRMSENFPEAKIQQLLRDFELGREMFGTEGAIGNIYNVV